LTPEAEQEHQRQGVVPVVRFKMPLEGETVCQDFVRGEVRFENRLLDDFVLLKSDGYPTYHLANVVDDHHMEISHVMRAEEWLSSTPRHLLLYRAFAYEPPVFVHLPIILGPDRSKLSKRHGATSTLDYRDKGYLPEAMANYLALLGWSLDASSEIFSCEELVRHFSLERIVQSPAVFNGEKLLWMNGMYLRRLPLEELADHLAPFLAPSLGTDARAPGQRAYLLQILPLIQERIKTLAEGPELVSFFFADGLEYDPSLLAPKGVTREATATALTVALQRLRGLATFNATALEGVLRPLAEELQVKTGQLFGALRVATTGRTAAPPLFQTMEVLGKERCLERVERAISLLA
jgi:glutamyl-tRNA synthetase